MRRRVIVGVGEALLAETATEEQPAGLALLVPIHAVRLGHQGVAVSRLGQDRPGEVLLGRLREIGVDVEHLQTDPDLATGRIVVNALGSRRLDDHAAWDNLQWDFDLVDVAQRADAVVFGEIGRRGGQARSAQDRFLAECRTALRVFDLTNRGDEELSREHAMAALRLADAAVIDEPGLARLLPAAADRPPRDAALELMRAAGVKLVLLAAPEAPLAAHTAEGSATGAALHRREAHEAALVGFLHGMLAGLPLAEAIECAERGT